MALASFPVAASAQNALTPAERSVCDGISACVDLVLRHGPDEFDYTVLAKEIAAFGPKGRAALIKQLRKPEAASRAAQVLRLSLGGSVQLSPADIQAIDDLWGGPSTAALAASGLVSALPPPIALDMIARTLDSSDPDIAAQSRMALLDLPKNAPTFVRPAHYTPILQAALRSRDSGLARFVARVPAKGLQVPHEALLQSGEAALVTASYRALFAENKSEAFNALLSAMRAIKTPVQARAIGDMLAARNATREDGFYARFGAEISGDTEFPDLARAAGLQAYLSSLGNADGAALLRLNGLSIEPTPARRAAWAALLSDEGAQFSTYAKTLSRLGNKKTASEFGALFWDRAQATRHPARIDILMNSAGFVPDLRNKILLESLQADEDASLLGRALANVSKAPHVAQAKRIADIRESFPLLNLRRAAGASSKTIRALEKSGRSCRVPVADVSDLRDQMPFFETGRLPDAQGRLRPAQRGLLKTAQPTRTGWLAGYAQGLHQGGVIYFDNQSGQARRLPALAGAPIFAVLPARKLNLGEVADQFYVMNASGRVWRVSDQNGQFVVAGHVNISAPINGVEVTRGGELLLNLQGRLNPPPLIIYPDGSYALACAPEAGRVGGTAKGAPSLKQPAR